MQRASERIRLLDPLVANQIAAGEVVERPASVVKELLENALDAGARTVTLELHEGGRAHIEICDDGGGIDPEDAILAFARHATSKIRDADELARVSSYGFRGEALASIASVAKVVLESRRPGHDVGVRVEVAGSAAPTCRAVHCAPGTRIIVSDLFFNTPARQAFLRGAATELGHVLRLVEGLCLGRPQLHLTLRANGRRLVDWPARATLIERARDVLGPELAADLYPVTGQGSYRVEGLLSRPAVHRGTPSLCLLVDGRVVQDRTLAHAVATAYGDLLERGRHPVGVLHLLAPPGTVDVNVHPTKAEVRFASSRAVHAAIGEAVRAMIDAAPWDVVADQAQLPISVPATRSLRGSRGVGAARAGTLSGLEPQRRSQPPATGARPATLRFYPPQAEPLPTEAVTDAPTATLGRAGAPRGANDDRPPSAPAPDRGSGSHGAATTRSTALLGPDDAPGAQPPATPALDARRYLGPVAGGWLAFGTDHGVALVDQHGADERALGTRLRLAARAGALPSQRPLLPPLVPLSATALARLEAARDRLARLGIATEPAGSQAVLLRALPREVPSTRIASAAAPVLEAVASALADPQVEDEDVLAAIACAAALSPERAPSAAEVETLVASSAGVDLCGCWVHGRRVRIDLDASALERLARVP